MISGCAPVTASMVMDAGEFVPLPIPTDINLPIINLFSSLLHYVICKILGSENNKCVYHLDQ